MAVETPLHMHRVNFAHQGHAIDASMTALAADSFGDVDAVIEVNEIRHIMNAGPFERPFRAKALAHGFEQSAVFPDLGVAAHTDFGGGNASECRRFDAGMTIAAINTQSADMMIVAEGNGLIAHDVILSHIGRARPQGPRPSNSRQYERAAEYGGLGKGVHTGMKNLCHDCAIHCGENGQCGERIDQAQTLYREPCRGDSREHAIATICRRGAESGEK